MTETIEPTRLDKAILFAMKAHAGQYRKYGDTPYIYHPIECLSIATTLTHDEDVRIAALLHDTVEDTEVTLEDIEKAFGPRVRMLVDSETEKTDPNISREASWLQRKEQSLKELETAPIETKIIWLSDKVSNMRSFHNTYLEKGVDMWNLFNQKDPKLQKRHYERIGELLSDLNNTAAYREYMWRMNEIFKDVED